jgi:hypothetical protein
MRTAPRTKLVGWLVLLLLAWWSMPSVLAAQETRQIRRIPRPEVTGQAYDGPAPPLPTREECERAVRRIAADYGPGGLEQHLAAEFPYREEVLDLLEKVALYATRIELQVESIESVRVEPWRLLPAAAGDAAAQPGRVLVSDCLADVRTRLTFDDPSTGIRTVRDVGRAQWRLRFRTHVPE